MCEGGVKMRKENYIYNGEYIERITRAAAKKLYNAGGRVYAAPVNLNLYSPWAYVSELKKTDDPGRTFESIENAMIYYNCNPETGSYIKYFQVLPDMEKIQDVLYNNLVKEV
jgi:hypothetical protein